MTDLFGSVWFYAAAAGAVAVAYFIFGRKISSEEYSHKRSDDRAQSSSEPMTSVTPPRKGDYTAQQLLEHNGHDASKAVLLSLFSARRLRLRRVAAVLFASQNPCTTSLPAPVSTERGVLTPYSQGTTAPSLSVTIARQICETLHRTPTHTPCNRTRRYNFC
jgi:hypothetical protein